MQMYNRNSLYVRLCTALCYNTIFSTLLKEGFQKSANDMSMSSKVHIGEQITVLLLTKTNVWESEGLDHLGMIFTRIKYGRVI